jgi:hypothetical protein
LSGAFTNRPLMAPLCTTTWCGRKANTGQGESMPQDHAITTDTAINVDWPQVLDAYGVEFLVLDPHDDRELLDLFRSQPGWRVDFEDEEMALLVRRVLR